MVLTAKMSEIESSGVELHFSRTFRGFIITNEKVLAILIFQLLAMPAASRSRHVLFTKTQCCQNIFVKKNGGLPKKTEKRTFYAKITEKRTFWPKKRKKNENVEPKNQRSFFKTSSGNTAQCVLIPLSIRFLIFENF